MNRYEEMLVFVRAVEDGSFSAAARNLSLTPSAVSKLIARLEDRLSALLFRRAHRTVSLTPEGETFYHAALDAIAAVEGAETAITRGSALHDTLRVRSVPIFATAALAAHIPAFCERHPRLRVEVQLRINPGQLLDEGTDVAIHVGRLEDSSLVARRFSGTRWIVCAAPAYAERHGLPGHPDDLARHNCLNFLPSMGAATWSLRNEDGSLAPRHPASRFVTNQASLLIELALTGFGIVRLAELQVAAHLAAGRLVELFPQHQSPEEDPIWAVYHSRRHVSARVRAFLDFLDGAFASPSPWTRWRH
jgi:DNA-binding transcriptional LysR family regulator